MPYLQTTDGTQLAYETYGEGSPVLFCNSVMLSTAMWDYQVPFLVDHGYRCVLLDWRGDGRSDRPSGGYDLQTLATDLSALVEQLELRDIQLVGHSMGGAVAVRYLVDYGRSRVRNLTLISAMLPFLKQTPDNPEGIPEALFEAMAASVRTDRT